MAVPKQKIEWQNDEALRPMAPAGQLSARALQQLLSEQTGNYAEPDVERWSRRRSMAFIVASAAVLWAALIVTAHSIVVAIA